MKVTYFRWQGKCYLFVPKCWPSLVCGLLFLLLLGLGCWQLYRYEWRTRLVTQFQQRSQQQVRNQLPNNSIENINYIRVRLSGHFLNDLSMALLNRTRRGKVGFDVLTPFQPQGDSRLLLVNRGWKPQESFNGPVAIKRIVGAQQLQGYLVTPNPKRFILGENIANVRQWPLKMLRIDTKELAHITGKAFYPYVLRLDPAASSGLRRDWPIVTDKPARHLGYAVQWFAMALVLIFAYLFLSTQVIYQGRCHE